MTKKGFIINLSVNIACLIAVVPVCALSLKSYKKIAYEEFFVVGSSMQPTLVGERNKSSYGICDKSEQAINALEHFDIVVCYYPFENGKENDYSLPYIKNHSILKDTATLKVKRVIGLPGDHLVINNEVFSITSTVDGKEITTTYGEGYEEVPFQRQTPINGRVADITLAEDEYFVMGDNWTTYGSLDCCNPGNIGAGSAPLYKENIAGVVTQITGYCTIIDTKLCTSCNRVYDADRCPKCKSTDYTSVEWIGERNPFEDGPEYLL